MSNTPISSPIPPSPSIYNLTDYVAVSGKIIPIPGTDFVIVTPENEIASPGETLTQETDISEPPALDQYSTSPGPSNPILISEDSSSNENSNFTSISVTPLPPIVLPVKKKKRKPGRPPINPEGCTCPNCLITPNSDRHLCHFPSCGKTFTKVCHLEAHLRNHNGSRPFRCAFPSCNSSFVRADDLKRHSLSHDNSSLNRWICELCFKRFRRADHHKAHIKRCIAKLVPKAIITEEELRNEENLVCGREGKRRNAKRVNRWMQFGSEVDNDNDLV
jgi:hypothetical protein